MDRKLQRVSRQSWLFTAFDDIEKLEQQIKQVFDGRQHIYCCIYQREQAEGGQLHLQGVLQFHNKIRCSKVKTLLENRTMHLEPVKKWDCAVEYSTKLETRVSEPVHLGEYVDQKKKISNAIIAKKVGCGVGDLHNMDKDERIVFMREKYIHSANEKYTTVELFEALPGSMYEIECALKQAKIKRQIIDEITAQEEASKVVMRPWQAELEEELQHPADPRKVVVYVDPIGNRGKSFFKKFYCCKYPGTAIFYEEGKSSDIKHVIAQLGYSPRVIFLDVSRQVFDDEGGKDYFNYKLIESIKNGIFTSTKYGGHIVRLAETPHFVVFANQDLHYEKMSRDRWVLRKFKNDNEVEEFTIENVSSTERRKWIKKRMNEESTNTFQAE